MSYCRFSEDSEVYVWTSGLYITVQLGKNNKSIRKSFKEFKVGDEQKTIDYLNNLKLKGILIPKEVFVRLEKELKSK